MQTETGILTSILWRLFEILTFFVNLVKICSMRRSQILYSSAFLALCLIAMASCRKQNGIDNDSVIKKPYGLYLTDNNGALFNTNDGILYKTVFPTDGFSQRALTTSGLNIIWVKENVHLSEDNGKNFNPTYKKAYDVPLVAPVPPVPYRPWQPMILDVADQNRVYLASTEGKGIVISEDNGKTWMVDTSWDVGVAGKNITSFAELKDGTLFAHNLSKDSLYKRDNKTDRWTRIAPTTALPGAGQFYISHFNNTLVATDLTGGKGAYYSNDNGVTWTAYTGLPARILYATAAPFEQTLLVGTDSNGIYRLQGTTFVPANNGLEDYTTVYSIIGKDDIYKNDATKRYIYIATNKGLYRSEDAGQNWILLQPGHFVGVY